MKKLQSSLKNMLLVLTAVTVIAVGLLAYVNELTTEPIAQANLNTLNDALRRVVPDFDNNPVAESDTVYNKDGKIFIIYPASKDGKPVGTAVESKSLGFGGEIKVLVGFDQEDKIYDYSILSQAETPGLGTKMVDWFKPQVAREKSLVEKIFGFEMKATERKSSILGMSPGAAPLTVANDGGQIDAITASTITSRAFLVAVNEAYGAYKGDVDAASGATSSAGSDANTSATTQAETDGESAATPQQPESTNDNQTGKE